MRDYGKIVVYQIYPKSFNDSNGDGIGDLNGIIEKLDYLQNLGVDYLWLTPFYKSPQRDNGYDVSDYYSIDEKFGTMDDFEKLIKESRKRNINIMIDMVFNHTSTEHPWFQKALNGDEKYKNFYIFKKGKNNKEPTNWASKFGGSAWEYVEKLNEYYLHLFDKTQADLNWDNEDLRKEIFKVVNFWIKKGVKGFRLDVINLISKPKIFEDDNGGDGRKYYTDGYKIHEYLKELNKNTFGKYSDIVTVGEMSSTTIENCIKYSNPMENELSMVFNFHHLKVDYKDGNKWTLMDFDFLELKKIFENWQLGMEKGNGWNALFMNNHDQPRALSRFGNENKYYMESAKMLGTFIHMLRGTPYIYQGEEIGMTNPNFESIEEYRDVESINYYNILKKNKMDEKEILNILKLKSRDNSRTPIQWNSEKNAGFSKVDPWINLCKNYEKINVQKVIKEENSIFHHYKKLISLRKKYDIISKGTFKMILKEDSNIFAYLREYKEQILLVINNFYDKNVNVKINLKFNNKTKILISNYNENNILSENMIIRPYESTVYLIDK